MSDFLGQVNGFVAKASVAVSACRDRAGDIVHDEWVNGGPITGAPGQPVSRSGSPNDGELIRSFTRSRTDDADVTSTDCRYAPDVEDNVNGFTFASGGAHGMKLVVAGWKDVVAVAAAEVTS